MNVQSEYPALSGSSETESGFQTLLRILAANYLALFSLVVFGLICIIAVLAPWISPQDPHDLAALNLLDSRLPPLSEAGESGFYLLGTDNQGRDMLSAIFYGLRTSLFVGICSVAISLCVGTALGLLAGYFGGWVDAVIMRLVDLQLSFPAILVALILLAMLGRGVDKIVIALVVVQWVYFARAVRSSTLTEMKKEYVAAAYMLGYSHFRILARHILPNVLAPASVVAAVEFSNAIALEATLSFLGIGLPVTEPSLGLLIANGFAYLLNGEYWVSIYPGIALLLIVFSILVLSEHLREVFNPRSGQ